MDAPGQRLRRRGGKVAAEPFPAGGDVLAVDGQDHVSRADLGLRAVGIVGDIGDHGPALDPFHLDGGEVRPEVLPEAGVVGEAVGVPDVRDELHHLEGVVGGVRRRLKPGDELVQGRLPGPVEQVLVREEIVDDVPEPEQGQEPVFFRGVCHLGIGVLSEQRRIGSRGLGLGLVDGGLPHRDIQGQGEGGVLSSFLPARRGNDGVWRGPDRAVGLDGFLNPDKGAQALRQGHEMFCPSGLEGPGCRRGILFPNDNGDPCRLEAAQFGFQAGRPPVGQEDQRSFPVALGAAFEGGLLIIDETRVIPAARSAGLGRIAGVHPVTGGRERDVAGKKRGKALEERPAEVVDRALVLIGPPDVEDDGVRLRGLLEEAGKPADLGRVGELPKIGGREEGDIGPRPAERRLIDGRTRAFGLSAGGGRRSFLPHRPGRGIVEEREEVVQGGLIFRRGGCGLHSGNGLDQSHIPIDGLVGEVGVKVLDGAPELAEARQPLDTEVVGPGGDLDIRIRKDAAEDDPDQRKADDILGFHHRISFIPFLGDHFPKKRGMSLAWTKSLTRAKTDSPRGPRTSGTELYATT